MRLHVRLRGSRPAAWTTAPAEGTILRKLNGGARPKKAGSQRVLASAPFHDGNFGTSRFTGSCRGRYTTRSCMEGDERTQAAHARFQPEWWVFPTAGSRTAAATS